MNEVSSSIFMGVALASLLVGCQRNDGAGVTSGGEPLQTVTNMTPIPQMPGRNPSLPDAATAFAEQDAANKDKAMQDTAALQQNPAPQSERTKDEESKAMPLPSQANDHSTTAIDNSKAL